MDRGLLRPLRARQNAKVPKGSLVMLPDIVNRKTVVLLAIAGAGFGLLLAGCPAPRSPIRRTSTMKSEPSAAIGRYRPGLRQLFLFPTRGGPADAGDIKHYQSFSNTKSSKLTLSPAGSVVTRSGESRRRRLADRWLACGPALTRCRSFFPTAASSAGRPAISDSWCGPRRRGRCCGGVFSAAL